MADGTISFAEGLGSKALDSNEMRRKLRVTGASLTSDSNVSSSSLGSQPGNPNPLSPSPDSLDCSHSQSSLPDNPFNSSPGAVSRSPKSGTARKLQQALFEEGLIVEAEERTRQEQQQEVLISNPKPKTLFNARGTPYLEGDPNLGYDEIDNKPRRPRSFNQADPSHPTSTSPHHPANKPPQIPNGIKPKPKNWASLLQSRSSSSDMKLEFYTDICKGKEAQVEIDIELTDVGRWSRYLVGHFLDGKMPYPLVLSTARYQWKELFVAVKPHVAGCYLFEFRDEQAKQQVLDGGPYFFSQKYLVLKDWHRTMKPVKEQPSHIPAWVRLHDLPLELWNQECLSRIASTIGKPLHVDQATAKTSNQPGLLQTISTSARVCIEISAELDLPEDVRIIVEGNSVVVPIEYQVLPPLCKQCKVFGHSTTQCSKKLPSTSNPSTTLTASPTSAKLAINCPQAEILVDSEQEAANHEWIQVGNGSIKTSACDSLADSASPQHFNGSKDPTVIQVGECSESEVKLLEILGGTSLTSSKSAVSQVSNNTDAPKSGACTEGISPNPVGLEKEKVKALSDLKKPPAPEPPDYQGLRLGEEAATLVSDEIIDPYQLLSRSARRKMRKQAREQPMGSLSN